jgi:hypothetical protein
MTKMTASATVPKGEEGLRSHVQTLTNDLKDAFNGGGINTENLPFKLFSGSFVSGVAREINAYGASVVFSEGVITKTAYKVLKNGLLQVTLTFEDGGTYPTTFITVAEKLPSGR